MLYRIIKETNQLNEEKYYIEKKVLGLFWLSLKREVDITMALYVIYFNSLGEAEEYLKCIEKSKDERKKRKAIERKPIYYKQIS